MDLEVAQGVLWSFVQITNRILGLSHGLCPIFNAVTDIGLSNSEKKKKKKLMLQVLHSFCQSLKHVLHLTFCTLTKNYRK